MALAVGSKAPDFTLPTKTADGPRPVRLGENFGNKNTLLLFFPMAFTGTCTKEMCGVGNGLREYADLNCEVYGISGDNPFAQEAWAQKEKINVTLLSDYEHKVDEAIRRDLRFLSSAARAGLCRGRETRPPFSSIARA